MTSSTTTCIATCPDALGEVLVRQLQELGARDVRQGYRMVEFQADKEVLYRALLNLPTASRILQVVREGPAGSPEALFQQASRVPWDRWLPAGVSYKIDAIAGDRGPGAMPSSLISKKVREGLLDWYRHHKIPPPVVDLQEPRLRLSAFVYGHRVVLSLDLAGKALHKRGYRVRSHPSPLKETLAAGLLQLAGYTGAENFYDPFCGSGTLAIEAAYLALSKGCLIHRKKGEFGLEHLRIFDSSLWRRIQDETRRQKRGHPPAGLFAADIEGRFVEDARQNALQARVERHIQFHQGSFFERAPPAPTGILVSNLPYGERLDETMSKELYQEIGNTLKRRYGGWKAALLVAEDSPWKFIGLRPSRRIPVLNGSIRCRLLLFEIYDGSRREKG